MRRVVMTPSAGCSNECAMCVAKRQCSQVSCFDKNEKYGLG